MASANKALDRIGGLLAELKYVAVQATTCTDAEREELAERFNALLAQVDFAASGEFAQWSQRESERIRKMIACIRPFQ